MKSQTLLLAKNKRLVGLAVLATEVVLFLVIPDGRWNRNTNWRSS